MPLIKFKCIPIPRLLPDPDVLLRLLTKKSKYATKHLIKWGYDLRSYESNFFNCVEKPENFRTSNGVWTRDLAIPVRRSNQLSYEATDVGSWSFVGSNGPVRNESMMKWYMKWIIYELRIWNQVKLWSSQLWEQFLQLRREAWKIQDFNGVWTRDLAIPVRRSNQLSYEATDVGSHKTATWNHQILGFDDNVSILKWNSHFLFWL